MSVAQRDGIRAADGISYDDLYRRWEQGNWSATAIDFSADRDGWKALSDIQRKSALWIYSMFFYGEDSVADNLSPYIDAAPKEEQKYFLTTQQVDEARHAVFFHRFFKEVIGAGESISSTLAYTEAQLGWGYRNVFERLDRMADDLRRDRSLPNFARAIALYHMVVEATLAQPGQHYIEDYFAKAGTMPGFNEGMANVSRDEQRHIGFGVKVLAECFAESDECKEAVRELLLELLPFSLAVFAPPNWNLDYTRCYGFELEDIYAFGLRSVRTKWRATGYPIEDMPGVLPDRSRARARGGRAAPDQAAEGRRHGRAQRPSGLLARDPAALLRHRLAGRAYRRGQRRRDDDPVALRGRRPLAPADRQRRHRGGARAGARRRSHDRDDLERLDRRLDQGREPAPGAASAPDPPARIAAQPDAVAEGLPAAPDATRLTRAGASAPPLGAFFV